jgi:hypothetical protein
LLTRTFFCCASGRPTARPSDIPVRAATNPASILCVHFIVSPRRRTCRSSTVGLVDRQTNTRNVPLRLAHSRRVQRLVHADVSGDRVAVGVAGQKTDVPRFAVAAAVAVQRVEHVRDLACRSMCERCFAGETTGIERWTRLATADAATHLRRGIGGYRRSPPAPCQPTAHEERQTDCPGDEYPSPRDESSTRPLSHRTKMIATDMPEPSARSYDDLRRLQRSSRGCDAPG